MEIRLLLVTIVGVALVLACTTVSKKKAGNGSGRAHDLTAFPNALYPVATNGKWGYVNNRMEVIVEPKFMTAGDFHEGLASVSMPVGTDKSKELFGYIDTTGGFVVPCKYEGASSFSEGFAAVKMNGMWGFINRMGREVIKPSYEEVSEFSEGLAAVKSNGTNGFIDSSGKMIINPQFARACWVSDFSEGLAAVYISENGPGGYINKTGTLVIPADYDYVSAFSEGLALVQNKATGKYGYINHQAQFVIKPKYELSLPFSEGLATVKLLRPDGSYMYQVIDKSGKTVIDDLKYAFVGIFREGMAGVETLDHQWGFIDPTGKEVIPAKFASVRLFQNGLSRIETGNLFGGLKVQYINRSGKIVWND